jgi:hypothetical protein
LNADFSLCRNWLAEDRPDSKRNPENINENCFRAVPGLMYVLQYWVGVLEEACISESGILSDKRQRWAAAKPRYPAASLAAKNPFAVRVSRAASSFLGGCPTFDALFLRG